MGRSESMTIDPVSVLSMILSWWLWIVRVSPTLTLP